jgi:hypothetical protein
MGWGVANKRHTRIQRRSRHHHIHKHNTRTLLLSAPLYISINHKHHNDRDHASQRLRHGAPLVFCGRHLPPLLLARVLLGDGACFFLNLDHAFPRSICALILSVVSVLFRRPIHGLPNATTPKRRMHHPMALLDHLHSPNSYTYTYICTPRAHSPSRPSIQTGPT